MPALNFKSEFVGLVQSGKKTRTIRAPRKRPIKVGDTVILSSGARTKHYRQIGEGIVTEVDRVDLRLRSGQVIVIVSSHVLDPEEAEVFAKADGFAGFAEMVAWFERQHGLPFAGHLIRWQLKTAP